MTGVLIGFGIIGAIIAAGYGIGRSDLLGPGAGRVLGRLADPPAAPFPQLTPRELEILDHVAAGRPTADIARALGLSVKTVGNNVSNVLAKLGLADRAQAAVVARDAGLGRR